MRPETDVLRLELGIELADVGGQFRSFDAQAKVAQPQIEQLLVRPACPHGLGVAPRLHGCRLCHLRTLAPSRGLRGDSAAITDGSNCPGRTTTSMVWIRFSSMPMTLISI